MMKFKICLISLLVYFQMISPCFSNKTSLCEKNDTKTVNSWAGNGYDVVVCSYGSSPTSKKDGWWRGSGLTFYKVTRNSQSNKIVMIKDHSERGYDIDYRYSNGVIEFKIYTDDPKGNELIKVPFIKESVNLDQRELVFKKKLLHAVPQYDKQEVERLLSLLLSSDDEIKEKCPIGVTEDQLIVISLYRLRNFGLAEPNKILHCLDRLKNAPWKDGSLSLTYKDIRAELEEIVNKGSSLLLTHFMMYYESRADLTPFLFVHL